jgi:hypothetical protein
VKTVLDREVTVAGLDAAVNEMGADIHPRDTFVLFAAGHGYSHQERFSLPGRDEPRRIDKFAIDQARLQEWSANRIKAKKALILLDTLRVWRPHQWLSALPGR